MRREREGRAAGLTPREGKKMTQIRIKPLEKPGAPGRERRDCAWRDPSRGACRGAEPLG